MCMMNSKRITPEMVNKFIEGLYKDTYPGFIKDYRVEVINHIEGKFHSLDPEKVIIHVLMDDDVYISTGEGYFAVEDMEKKLNGIMKYLPYPVNVSIKRYISDDHGGLKVWEDKFGVNK